MEKIKRPTKPKNLTNSVAKKSAANKTDLIIVESPTKAKKISKFLGSKYTVIASNGHVRDLPKSTLGIDTEANFAPSYITVRGRGDVLNSIRKSAKNAGKIYLATDPDREGEAISWHLAHILKMDDTQKCRIVFNEITVNAVKNALKNARCINSDLVNAQQARRVLDRLVGYKISPILWAKVKNGLSAGRVQSVATKMICDREAEIEAFVPKEFWTVTAKLSAGTKATFNAKFFGYDGKKFECSNEKEANEVISKTKKGGDFTVSDIKIAKKNRHAPAPFTTSSMQQEASKKLGMTSERTMRVAQELYEGASFDSGLISYMRTDSVRISDEAQGAALEYIKEAYGTEYAPEKPNIYKGSKNAQDAHEAIRPTNIKLTPSKLKDKLTPQQYKLYKLIFDRFLASQMTEAVVENTTVTLSVADCTYKANGIHILFKGFMAAYQISDDEEDEGKEASLPKLEVNNMLNQNEVFGEQHFTQPPSRYNDASMIKALDEYGIGRPSTYAPTISTIIARGYIRREKKMLVPTELGHVVTEIMKENFKDIVDIKFTAEMEDKLDSIEEGGVEWTNVIDKFYKPFEETVNKASESIEKITLSQDVSDIKCDKCGQFMVYKIGRFGKFLACPNYPECKNTKPVIEKIDAPCPKCGAAVIKRTSRGKGNLFYGCERYPECDFISWDLPLTEKCTVCGEYMVQKQTKRGRYKACSNKDCKTNKRKKEESAEKSEE